MKKLLILTIFLSSLMVSSANSQDRKWRFMWEGIASFVRQPDTPVDVYLDKMSIKKLWHEPYNYSYEYLWDYSEPRGGYFSEIRRSEVVCGRNKKGELVPLKKRLLGWFEYSNSMAKGTPRDRYFLPEGSKHWKYFWGSIEEFVCFEASFFPENTD